MIRRRQSVRAILPGDLGFGLFTNPDEQEMRRTAPLRRLWICLVCQMFLVTSVSFGAGQDAPALVDGGNFDCLPIADFGLRGVRLGEPEDAAKGKLGEPLRRSEGGGEDDGGWYLEVTYHYQYLEISIVRGAVDRIYTVSPRVSMDSGVRVGLSRAEIIGILGREPRNLQINEAGISIVTCPENGEWIREDYVFMKFDEAGILKSIEFLTNRP